MTRPPPCTSETCLRLVTFVVGDYGVDGFGEYLLHSGHLFTAALHVPRSHLAGYVHALLLGDRGQSLSLEEVDTGAFRAEIGLEADEDEGCVGAKMQDLGVPLL